MKEEKEVARLLKEWDRLSLVDGVLYRRRQDDTSPDVLQLVVPKTLKKKAFTGIHDDMGHLGIERTLDLARSRFFWLKMSKEIEMMVKSCKACALRKIHYYLTNDLVFRLMFKQIISS